MKKILYILALTATTMVSAQAGIGTVTPDPDSALEVASTDKGLLVPRIALTGTANAAPLSAHVRGMMIYNIATAGDVTPGFYVNDGTKWVMMADTTSEPWRNPDGTAAAGPTSTDINYMNGNLGIGTTTPDSPLKVLSKYQSVGGSNANYSPTIQVHNTVPSGNSQNFTSIRQSGIESFATQLGTGNITTLTSGYFRAFVGNGSATNLTGISSNAFNNIASTGTNITSGEFNTFNQGTVTNENILNLQAFGNLGTATNFNGININDIFRPNTTNVNGINIGNISSTGTTAHGLKIGDVIGAAANYAIQTGVGEVSFGDNVGIGSTDPSKILHIRANGSFNGGANGIFLQDNNPSEQSPIIRVQGSRSDPNISQVFGGGLVLDRRYDGGAVNVNMNLGSIYFGGHHTNNDHETNTAYAASISGIANGNFNSASDMPTGLVFRTGQVGRIINITNLDFGTIRMVINSSGNVGIGTELPTQKLHVIGNILASGSITPDYVFQNYYNSENSLNPSYKMMSLTDVEGFTKVNNHLPGISSAAEVEAQGGIILNRASEQQLEKIEELFLHTIEQEKKIEALKEDNNRLKARLDKIEEMLKTKE